MSYLKQLHDKLAAESGFKLEQRTIEERLENIAKYSALIPFASDATATWKNFWMSEVTAQELANVYKNTALAKQILPVQQAFLLAVLELLETPTLLLNTLPTRHRALYYYDLLGFTRRAALPDTVAVSFTLLRNQPDYLLVAGTALDAGPDESGNALTYLTDRNLLITSQELSQVCWTRQQESTWVVSTVLDLESNISLPSEGLRLFSLTDNDKPLQKHAQLNFPLGALMGEIYLEAASGAVLDGTTAFALVGKNGQFDFKPTKLAGDVLAFRLPEEVLYKARKEQPSQHENLQLSMMVPADLVALPEALKVTIGNCQQIGYRAQDGERNINGYSYPFGRIPISENVFELTLPVEFSKNGGELTLQPQWVDLPKVSFAQWYADYPDSPADNSAFKVRIDLLSADGTEIRGEEQSLFSGDGVPQGEILRLTIPANSQTTSGDTVRVVLLPPDFLHSVWQENPENKNLPWAPQVSKIHTVFQTTLGDIVVREKLSRLQASIGEPQALYLGFSGVNAGDILSLYWSMTIPSALDLVWHYYNEKGQWMPLVAGVEDGTRGLSTNGLWQTTLPGDAVRGSEYTNLSAEYFWIKAIEASGAILSSDKTPKLNAIFAGAVTATLNTATEVERSHFSQPLAADTSSQLATPIPQISQVSQPLPSIGGKASESEAALLQRAATRIAHRQRAISWGNMRSLLMDNYPQLYDVQFPDVEKLNHIPALEVQKLLIIPISRYRDNEDALRPTLSEGKLTEMVTWLKRYTSLWAMPVLENPVYVDVTASYTVLFSDGISQDWGYSQLASWLQKQYMPWGEDQQLAVTPGNQIDYFQLLATIQKSSLVQRVTSLTLSRDKGIALKETLHASEHEVLILIPVPAADTNNGESDV
jgi:hypothetical protein